MSNFSCAEPNVGIKYMKSSTYESIKIDIFEFRSTLPFLSDWASRKERQKFDSDSNVELFMCRI